MKRKLIILSSLFCGIFICFNTYVQSSLNGAPSGYSGAPGDYGNCRSCHSSYGLNSGGGSIIISVADANGLAVTSYKAGQTYKVKVTVAKSGVSRFGFEAIAKVKGTSTSIGTSSAINTDVQVSYGYATHTRTGTNSSPNSKTFEFNWTAPSSATQTATIYAAGNATNANNSESGDYIYTSSLDLSPAVNSSVAGETFQGSLNFYPNPVNDQLTIDFNLGSPAVIDESLYTMDGKLVKTLSHINYQGGNERLYNDLSGLPAGLYLLRLSSNEVILTRKLIKE